MACSTRCTWRIRRHPGRAAPRSGVVAGLDLSGYTTTPAVPTPTVNGQIDREVVLIEWKDRNIANTTFEGTARELLRVQYPLAPHPLGEMTFNPAARPGDPDWRVMYLGAGDSQSGEQRDSRRLNPQRLDTLVGKILRIIPDLREHANTSTVSENGRYRIPNDNPFMSVDGARKEVWAYGLRNPHRLDLGRDPRNRDPLLAFDIGLVTWETVQVIHKGANYGYPLREGTQSMSPTNGMGPLPEDDEIPIQISDTVTHGTVKPTYPVIEYPHSRDAGGDAIAGGFVYRGTLVPALKDKLVFGDITVGRIWYADRAEVLAADDGNPSTLAAIHEMDTGLRQLTEETFRRARRERRRASRNGAQSGRGRVDLRFGVDNDGELYILTKSDGMIRKVVGARAAHDHDHRSQRYGALAVRHAALRANRRIPNRSRPVSGPTTPTVRPATAIARKARSRPASRSPSSKSSTESRRRISPTTSGITDRAMPRSSTPSSTACRRR